MIHHSITQSIPEPVILFPGRILTIHLPLHMDKSVPETTLVAFYGSNMTAERALFQPILQDLIQRNSIIMGDFNACTFQTDTTGLTDNIWPWLKEKETGMHLIDTVRTITPRPPFTRTRGYGSSKSYLDRIYTTRISHRFFQASKYEISSGDTLLGFVDHDPVSVYMHEWGWREPSGPRPTLWNKAALQEFKKIMSNKPPPEVPINLQETTTAYQEVIRQALQAVQQVNDARYPRKTPEGTSRDWIHMVRMLQKQCRKRSKLFYRRLKSTLLIPQYPPLLPIPGKQIQEILQQQTLWNLTAVDHNPKQETQPEPKLPTKEELRKLAWSRRNKAPGPDGLPPYILAQLPTPWFAIAHNYICQMLTQGYVPPEVSASETLCVFKNKGDWRDAKNWRPIAMSNSIYRLLMRWITHIFQENIEGQLDDTQFGGRKGRSPGMATLHLLDQIEKVKGEYLVLVDLYHAFDTPPKELLMECLRRAGLPEKIILLLSSVLFQGKTRLKSTQLPPFLTTHGTKQGCPFSPLLFTLFFNSILRELSQKGLKGTAFMDDLAFPTHSSTIQRDLALVQQVVHSHGMCLNVSKCEILPLNGNPPSSFRLPTRSPTTFPTMQPNPHTSQTTVPCVTHVLHLGHPLTANMDPKDCASLVIQEVRGNLESANAQPIPTLARIEMLRSLVLPTLLYRLEHLCPHRDQINELQDLLNNFILSVAGLTTKICSKTMYSPPRIGLGVPYLPVLIPTRVLDLVQKSARLFPFCISATSLMTPIRQLRAARKMLAPNHFTFQQWEPAGNEWQSLSDLTISQSSHRLTLPPSSAYSDGSLLLSSGTAGGASVLPNGLAICARCPGRQSIYKSELLGICLAAAHSPPGTTIWSDSKGAVKAVQGDFTPVKEKTWVLRARSLVKEFSHTISWIKGHAESEGNNYADFLAKAAAKMLPQPPQKPQTPWEFAYEGEVFHPPHKVWTHDLIPTHSQTGIHQISFAPLRRQTLGWIKWIFAHVWRPGFSHFCTFWSVPPKASRIPCNTCGTHHNLSVHGIIAFCSESHPLVQAWSHAWGPTYIATIWRRSASQEDLRLLGKLCIPNNLYIFLSKQLGRRGARSAISGFQQRILPLLDQTTCTPQTKSHPPPKFKRPSPWKEEDYDHGLPAIPIHKVKRWRK